ncbi:MAG: hypothetical protein IPJ40_20565 [Saprospirales bacterium]|nr:hypothetical protein [Saprospirales bacterium]
MKKWKLPAIILLVLSSLFFLLWGTHQFYPLPFVKVSSFRAVPKYSSFVFMPSSFRETPSPWDAWNLSPHWSLLQLVEGVLADTTTDIPSFRRTIAVLQPMGKAQMGWLGIWDVPQAPEKLQRWLAIHPGTESRFKQVSIYSGKTNEGQPFAIAQFHNLIMAAPFPFLLEDAIRELKRFSLDRAPLPTKTNPYCFQPSQVPLQWTTVLSNENRGIWDLFREWNGWANLEVTADSLGWKATGQWKLEKDSSWMDLLETASPASPDSLFAIMPEQLLTFFWAPPTEGTWWETGAARRFLKPWWSGEWAVGLLPGYGLDTRAPLFWVGKIRSQAALESWLTEWATEQGELPSHTYQTFQIRQIMAEPLLPLPWSEEPLPLRNPYLVQIDNYVVLTDSKPSLEVWLDQYISGQVLARTSHFLEASSQLPLKATAWGYIQADRLGPMLAKTFQPEQTLPFFSARAIAAGPEPG